MKFWLFYYEQISMKVWKIIYFVQEMTAGRTIEQPDIAVYKLLMRQHVHECLNILKPRERTVILHRFGIFGRERKSVSEIGSMFGLTKERIRQIECCAMQKLREIALREDLSAYTMFLNWRTYMFSFRFLFIYKISFRKEFTCINILNKVTNCCTKGFALLEDYISCLYNKKKNFTNICMLFTLKHSLDNKLSWYFWLNLK